MNREEVRLRIIEAIKQRHLLKQKMGPTPLLKKFDIPFIVTFITPYLLFVAYASIWNYDHAYLSFFGVNLIDFIELNLFSSTAIQVFSLVFISLAFVFTLIVYLHSIYIDNSPVAFLIGIFFSLWSLIIIKAIAELYNIKFILGIVHFLLDPQNDSYLLLFIILFPIVFILVVLRFLIGIIKALNKVSKEILFSYLIVLGIFLILFFGFKGKHDAEKLQSATKLLITQIDKKDYIVIKAYSNKIICKLKDTKDTVSPSIVILQGTENIVVKQQSLPVASPSIGQQ